MLPKVKTLEEVRDEINETLGVSKKFNAKSGFFSARPRGFKETLLIDSKVHKEMSFKGTNQPISYGHFKSKKGYNSKYKNSKEFANHYGEYIAYIILKQLGKKACKVDLGEIDIQNPYTSKTINIEGTLSHYQLTQKESFIPIKEIIETYRATHPKKYKELTQRGKTNSDNNLTNIEIVLKTLEEFYTRNGQASKIPEMRKKFFDMCIWDLKFANRDRHDENFGVKVHQVTGEINFYHLFDNEQILGMQEDKNDIIKYLSNEKEYEKFKNRELTSCIGIPGETQKVTPQKLLLYLLENYYEETLDSLEDIGRYKFSHLEEVLEICPALSKEHKQLAKRIFKEREIEVADTIKEFNQNKLAHSKQNDGDEPSL